MGINAYNIYDEMPYGIKGGFLFVRNKHRNGRNIITAEVDTGEYYSMQVLSSSDIAPLDCHRFVKIYAGFINNMKNLNISAIIILTFILNILKAGDIIVDISYSSVVSCGISIDSRKYYRGISCLLENNYIARTPTKGRYWINVNYFFNGDRAKYKI